MLLPVVFSTLLLLPATMAIQSQPAADRFQLRDDLVLLISTATSKPPPPELGARVFVADRGSRKGQAAVVATADKTAGTLGFAEKLEYRLVAPGGSGSLPSVDVLGLHFVKVKPDRVDGFERFIRDTVHPAVGNLRPDLQILYYKDVRTPGSYLALFALTRASRDKYWPKGADSDELRAAFAPLKPLAGQLREYLVEGSYLADPKFAAAVFESREWSDFVLQPQRD
jgi:hypothetical protein